VLYTGRLFGYFRYPDIQASTDQGCPDVATTPLPPQAALFLSTLEKLRSAHQPLVSMGENFAPELLARAVLDRTPGSPQRGELINKDVLTAESDHIASDNVACFLRFMGFDAVVPGQQDFYYGPERLRQIARFLAQPGEGPYHPVQMLGANLIVSSALRKANPPLGPSELPAPIRSALENAAPFRFEIPSTVLPWIARIGLQGSAQALSVFDCPAAAEDPRDFPLPSRSPEACQRLPVRQREIVIPKAMLQPGTNHALCGV
jgi:hypothetical protein